MTVYKIKKEDLTVSIMEYSISVIILYFVKKSQPQPWLGHILLQWRSVRTKIENIARVFLLAAELRLGYSKQFVTIYSFIEFNMCPKTVKRVPIPLTSVLMAIHTQLNNHDFFLRVLSFQMWLISIGVQDLVPIYP